MVEVEDVRGELSAGTAAALGVIERPSKPAAGDTAAALDKLLPKAVKPGWKTTEFWLSVAVVVLNHVAGLLRQTPGTLGTVAGLVVDGLAVGGYNVSRGMAKRGAS